VNLSRVEDEATARTDPECALQRAENLAVLGVRSVLELCVGPSLRSLEEAYGRFGIRCDGNDVDPRWRDYHPDGRWLLGDCFAVDWSPYDAVVFAPPLSRGCTGRREDSLRVEEVLPRYADFVARPYGGLRVMVLPARSLSTREDRRQFHRLVDWLPADVVELTSGPRRIRKYVDVYFELHAPPPFPPPQDDLVASP
jgi:hypothetical protein